MEKSDLAATLRWLEEEQRQIRSSLARLSQQWEQLQDMVLGAEERLHSALAELATINSALARLPRLEEELRQVKEQLVRLQGAQTEGSERRGEGERLRLSELERERQARSELLRKVDLLEKEKEALRGKIQAMEELQKRHHEAIPPLHQRLEHLERQGESLEAKLARQGDGLRRWEQELARHEGELDALRKQDEVALSRMQLIAEQMRRVEEENQAILAQEALSRDLASKLELLRVEKGRLEQELTQLGKVDDTHRERLESQARFLSQLDGKLTAHADLIADLQRQLGEYRQQVAQHLADLVQLEEKHRQRQIAELEQQIRELRFPKTARS